jgi:anti-sigma-K factor RskA
MDDRQHDELRSLVAAYALGAVPPHEEEALRVHLLSCPECQAEADGYAFVSSKLALAVEPTPLPDGFADRVLEQVRPTAPESARKPSRRARRARIFAGVSFAAMAVAVAVLAFSLVNVRGDLSDERSITSAILNTEDGFRLTDGEAVAAMVPTETGSVFVVEGLDEVPEEKTYQLWLLGAEQPVSVGTFEVEDGRAVIETDLTIEGFDAAAVTVEPEGGSPGPTTEPVLVSA